MIVCRKLLAYWDGVSLAGVRRIDTPAYWPLLFAGRGAI